MTDAKKSMVSTLAGVFDFALPYLIILAVVLGITAGLDKVIVSYERGQCDMRWAMVPHHFQINPGWIVSRYACLVEVGGMMVPEDKAVFSNQPIIAPAEATR